MKKIIPLLLVCTPISAYQLADSSTPEQDIKLYRQYFTEKFPSISLRNFNNGVYAIDQAYWDSWRSLEEFPSYLPMIETGKEIWETKFSNGQSYADCFNNNPAQSVNYPQWDKKNQQVLTLSMAINQCRTKNNEAPYAYKQGAITRLTAFMAYQSRGLAININIPDTAAAINAYNEGKTFYFSRRGQRNFACAHCHMESAGQHLRSDTISPSLGHTSGWPSYRSEWGDLGSLHRRFQECNRAANANPFPAQSRQYRNLEYFLTHMSNGLLLNGPSMRK